MDFRKLLEPEETVGSLWHALVGDIVSYPRHPEAAVTLESVRERLAIVFRGLGGDPGIRIRAAMPQVSRHRRRFRQRLGASEETVIHTRIDGDHLYLPPAIDWLPTRELNAKLYTWLTAWASVAAREDPLPAVTDPLRADILFLRHADRLSRRVLAEFPGLATSYRELQAYARATRPERPLRGEERTVEEAIIALLGGPAPSGRGAAMLAAIRGTDAVDEWRADKSHRPHLRVPLWGEAVPRPKRKPSDPDRDEADEEERGSSTTEEPQTRRAKREDAPDIDRNDPLILNRFEKILSWTEFLRINRGVDDEDEQNARRAADDHQEINLVKTKRRAATKLKFDLDLSPEDVERERLSGRFLYPEWDYRRQAYLPEHCRVLASVAHPGDGRFEWTPDEARRRRIDAVRRQFEALRPKREIARRQVDGSELDMDALVRARCDFAARGECGDQVYLQTRNQARDLAVAVLIDVSRSTETYIENQCVLDVAKEALTAFTLGLAACGDDHAIYSFSSLKRTRVWVETLKDFDERDSAAVLRRIARLRPGHYTRLGAAIRHVSSELQARANQHRLLLVLTDGKPNDLDHYEGRYGVEDSARAIREARQHGQSVFGITIDRKAQAYFPYVFGRNAFAILSHVGALTRALPLIYQHIVA